MASPLYFSFVSIDLIVDAYHLFLPKGVLIPLLVSSLAILQNERPLAYNL